MAIQIKVEEELFGDDPPLTAYHVTLTTEKGMWVERYTKEQRDAFLRGVQAGVSLTTGEYVTLPDSIPS